MATNVMQRVRANRGLLLLALFFGVVSAALVYVFLSQAQEKEGGGGVSTLPVVVVAKDIAAGTKIVAEMVTVKSLPQEALLPNVFRRTEDVVGKFATVSLVAGEQVVPSRVATSGLDLSRFGGNPPLSLLVPQGKRALSVPIDQVSAVGGLIRPGDHVDVLYVVEDGLQACSVVQDVQVLAIAQAVTVPTPEAAQGQAGAAGQPAAGQGATTVKEANPAAGTATLAVTPVQALVVAGVMGAEGDLRLALRGQEERDVVQGLPACQITAVPPPGGPGAITAPSSP